jgi:hypothetical protein
VTAFHWKPSPEFDVALRAQHTVIGGFELVAYDLPPNRGTTRIVGWELYGPGAKLLAYALAASLEDAKSAVERRFLQMGRALKTAAPR